ncbi:MAG: hypothetical protein ACLT9T_00185 [Streptococcus salivarius]
MIEAKKFWRARFYGRSTRSDYWFAIWQCIDFIYFSSVGIIASSSDYLLFTYLDVLPVLL